MHEPESPQKVWREIGTSSNVAELTAVPVLTDFFYVLLTVAITLATFHVLFSLILHRNHLYANFYAFTFHMNFCLVILIAADQLHPASTPKDVHKAYCLHI